MTLSSRVNLRLCSTRRLFSTHRPAQAPRHEDNHSELLNILTNQGQAHKRDPTTTKGDVPPELLNFLNNQGAEAPKAPKRHELTTADIPPELLNILSIKERRAKFAHLKSFFEGLGSTQSRDTVWQPHHSLHHPQTTTSVTLASLVAAGAHMGHATALLNPNFTPYAYGTRAGITIIDLDHTLPLLRRAAALVRAVAMHDGAIVFVGTRPDLKPIVTKAAERLGQNGFCIAERWLPGTLTNRVQIFGPSTVRKTRVIPDLVIFLNPIQNITAIRECAVSHVPTIGIIDSNADPRVVMYPIPANDESVQTAEIIGGVLSIAGAEGVAMRMRDNMLQQAEEEGDEEEEVRASSGENAWDMEDDEFKDDGEIDLDGFGGVAEEGVKGEFKSDDGVYRGLQDPTPIIDRR